MLHSTLNPRLLLVEDDPVTLAFLAEASADLPAEVIPVSTAAEALAAEGQFAAWLIDAHLPDASGTELLARLRAANPKTKPWALAHTASQDAATHARLCAEGFDEVAVKPLPIGRWQALLRQGLKIAAAAPSLRDDAAALRAVGGSSEALQALRQLFLQELPMQHQRILAAFARGDAQSLRDELHRLKASCDFVGATGLLAASRRLHAEPGNADALEAFARAAQATEAAFGRLP